MINTKSIRKTIDKLVLQHARYAQQIRDEKRQLEQARQNVENIERAQQIVAQLAQTVQQQAHDQIAAVVSSCLEAVFDEPYTFKIHFDRKRGKTEARLVFVRDGHELTPTSGAGGGVVDVASFALRLACLMLTQPPRRRFICLDEPFKHLDDAHSARVGQLLVKLAADMGVQFFMVTHSPSLKVGKVIQL